MVRGAAHREPGVCVKSGGVCRRRERRVRVTAPRGRAGEERALGQRRGWRETKGTPEVEELWGLRCGGSGAEWKESAPCYVPWSIDGLRRCAGPSP